MVQDHVYLLNITESSLKERKSMPAAKVKELKLLETANTFLVELKTIASYRQNWQILQGTWSYPTFRLGSPLPLGATKMNKNTQQQEKL